MKEIEELLEEILSRLKRLEEVEKENKELKAWKESMLSIEATWDKQKVAELLGIGLGESIVENIEPKIIGLRKQVENLKCCGNCLNYIYDMEEDHHYCNKNIFNGKRHAGICSNNWQSDTMTREERK